MNPKAIKDLDWSLAIACQLQSVLHSLDELSRKVIYRQELKKETERYYKYIEKFVEGVTEGLPLEQAQRYSDIIRELDNIAAQIKIADDNSKRL